MSVVVVGAGLAGLAAASELVRHGFDVTVLEASGRVGGRMTSDEIDGVVVDRGAQFLSSAYEHVLSLCREASLESTLEETSPWIAVVRGGEVRRASYAHPLSFVGGGPLTWREGLRLGRRRAKLGRTLAQLPLSDYSAWHEHDDEDAGEWCRRVFGRGVADHLFAPLVEGFYFQSLDGMSKALPLALMQFGSRRPRTVTLRGGIGALPEALASRLDVTLDTSVERVEVAAGGVRVHLADHTLDCERVILATTASVAARLYPHVHSSRSSSRPGTARPSTSRSRRSRVGTRLRGCATCTAPRPTRGAAPCRGGGDRVAQERVPHAHRRAARRHACRRRRRRAPEAA